MKFPNRIIALLLCISIVMLCVPFTAYAAEGINAKDIKIYSVPVISNEYADNFVDFYEYQGKYYLDIQIIKELTRCTVEETDSNVKLVHGIREIEINKSDGHMTDSTIKEQGIVPFVTYDGKYLCEGIPMLIYLGAGCTIRDNNSLEVLMPTITIWESIMPNYLEYVFNASELYGGENNVKISLVCDVLSDILNGAGGHGLFAEGDTHLEDALYEILDVDLMKYSSVQETISAQNQNINDFLGSDAVLNVLEAGTDAYDAVSETLEYYSDFFLETEIFKNEKRWLSSYSAGNWKEASELSSAINKQVYEQSAIKSNLGKGRGVSDFLNIGMLALDTAVTSFNLMKYTEDTRLLFSRNINKEIFDYAGYNQISWNNVSDKITINLLSDLSIAGSTALEKVTDFVSKEFAKGGIAQALSAFTSKANIYVAAVQLATFVTSLTFHDLHKAYSADMNAIWLSTVQFDIAQLTTRVFLKAAKDEQFENIDSIEKLRNLMALYYRTTIAFSENFSISLNEFGNKNKSEWIAWFSDKNENSISNYMAIYLYRITNCTIVPIVDYNGLSDTLLKSDWIKEFEKKADPVITNEGAVATHLAEAPSGFTPIYTADELSKIQTHSFSKYILMNDIDLSDWGNWVPIAIDAPTGFSGVFDGNGYNILNINVDISKNGEDAYGGLFAKCWGGEIKNLGVIGGKISVKSYSYNMTAGGLVGYCVFDTKIANCFNTAAIEAASLGSNGTSLNNYAKLGGIIGDGNAIIENCFNTGNITAADAYSISYVGGIAGAYSNASMKNVYNIGILKSSAHYGSRDDNIGGIIAFEGNSNELVNCYYLNNTDSPIGYAFTKNISENVRALTGSEMKSQAAFSGFDFDNIWIISEKINGGYPYLKNVNFASTTSKNEGSSGSKPDFSVEQIRETIVGSWTGFPDFYSFDSDGTCTMFGDKKNKGTYRITDDKILYLSFPWMSESYKWNENSFTDKKGWYLTEYMLIIEGQECGHE